MLCLPHIIDGSVLSICNVLRAFVECQFGVESQSSYFLVDGHGEGDVVHLLLRCVVYSAGSCVKRVHVVLSGLRIRLFVCVYVCISCL